MEKSKSRRRDIQFFSRKNDVMFIVHNERAQLFAQQLEGDSNVAS